MPFSAPAQRGYYLRDICERFDYPHILEKAVFPTSHKRRKPVVSFIANEVSPVGKRGRSPKSFKAFGDFHEERCFSAHPLNGTSICGALVARFH